MKDKNKNKCLYCKYADTNEEFSESYVEDDVESYLICTNPVNIHSGRNINSGSNRLVSMDTDIKVPKISFQVDDDDCCGAFEFSKKVYDEINC